MNKTWIMDKKYWRLVICGMLWLAVSPGYAQSSASSYETIVRKYIDQYKGMAMRHMRDYHIPASIILAQGIIESRAGQSELAVKANNHFGIKCHREWNGPAHYQDDDQPGECFRKYRNAEESFVDHARFLTTRDRYKLLFSLDIKDYTAWAYGLKAAGYATNPKYPEILLMTIERFSLNQYDIYDKQVAESPGINQSGNIRNLITSQYVYFAPGPNSRKVYLNNHIQLVFAREGETLVQIARDFRIPSSKLMKFNDIRRAGVLHEGDIVYLQSKKRKAEYKLHVVEQGQTLWEISQLYGIKLKNLILKNQLADGIEPFPGSVLKLR